jgi:adhesin/invasin
LTLVSPTGAGQIATAGVAFSTPLTITVQDSNGSPVTGQIVSWAITSGNGSLSSYSSLTNASGVASTIPTITNPANLGMGTTASITASIVGASYVFTTGTITSGPAVLANSSTALSLTTQVADNSSVVLLTVTLKDQYFNPAVGKSISVTSNHTGDTITTSPAITNASGVAVLSITSSVIGGSTLTVNNTTDGLSLSGSSGIASGITWIPSTGISLSSPTGAGLTATAGVAFTTPLSITVKDAGGNLVSGQTVSWSITAGNGTLSS